MARPALDNRIKTILKIYGQSISRISGKPPPACYQRKSANDANDDKNGGGFLFYGDFMKDENYYVVNGWMINRLNLNGIRLHAFAIIYGFSQIEGNSMSAPLSYLEKILGCSRPTVLSCLRDLEAGGLIYKIKTDKIGLANTSYAVNLKVVELKLEDGNLSDTCKKILPGKKVYSNNIIYINNNIKASKSPNKAIINKASNNKGSYNKTVKSTANRILIQPKLEENGANCGFYAQPSISALLNEINGNKAVLEKFSLFLESVKEKGMKIGRVWLRAQIDLINWVEDNDDKILVLEKTMENGWKSLRFIIEKMFNCKIESQRRDIITKTKIGGCKYD